MTIKVNGFEVGDGSSLPTAAGANEIPVSSGAGTTYVATGAAGVRAAIGVVDAPAEIVNGSGTVGALTTTLGGAGYQAIRVSGVVRDASGTGLQARGTLRFSATGAGGEFYSILNYAGSRGTTTPGSAAGVSGVMAGEFDFLTEADGSFDFKISFTGGGPLVCVFAQAGAGVASTSGTLL